jgi:predicted DNA-binding transcriptional regulator YafY
VRALAKVVQVMPPRLRRRVEALRAVTVPAGWSNTGPSVDPGVLTVLAQACRDTERLEFSYTAAAGERTERHVEPLRLVPLGRRWYLVAYDLTRHDWRSFRLDRLDRPRNTGTRFRPRELPAEDAAAFVRAGIGNLPTSHAVEVLVAAPASTVREHLGRWAVVEEADDGRCLLQMRADSLDWPAMALGSLGADFTVLSPPELLDHVHRWARTFGRATGAPDRG